MLQAQQPSWPRTPCSPAHLRFPPTLILPSLNPPLSLCMTSSPGSCLHHLHIPGCSEISQVTRPEGEGNTGLSAPCHTFHTEKTTPWDPLHWAFPQSRWAPSSWERPWAAERGCAQPKWKLHSGVLGRNPGVCLRVSNLPSKSCFRG